MIAASVQWRACVMSPTFPEIAAFALAFLCLAFALGLLRRNRDLDHENRSLHEQIEDLSDETWRLRESAERAASLINTQGDLIVRRDAEGRITFANDAFCQLAGRGAEDV